MYLLTILYVPERIIDQVGVRSEFLLEGKEKPCAWLCFSALKRNCHWVTIALLLLQACQDLLDELKSVHIVCSVKEWLEIYMLLLLWCDKDITWIGWWNGFALFSSSNCWTTISFWCVCVWLVLCCFVFIPPGCLESLLKAMCVKTAAVCFVWTLPKCVFCW